MIIDDELKSNLLDADYSQIELRIMAHLSPEADLHRATAAEIFGVAPEEVSGDQRRFAKAINFSRIYGKSNENCS